MDKQVTQIPGPVALRYPESLRAANIEGEVIVAFIVGTDGRPELASLKVIRSSHALFTQSVRDVIPSLRFTPAEIRGRTVRQLVQQPFNFSLTR